MGTVVDRREVRGMSGMRKLLALGVSVLARKVSAPRPDLQWNLTAADVIESEYPIGRK
jgi:hypothetical protein